MHIFIHSHDHFAHLRYKIPQRNAIHQRDLLQARLIFETETNYKTYQKIVVGDANGENQYRY